MMVAYPVEQAELMADSVAAIQGLAEFAKLQSAWQNQLAPAQQLACARQLGHVCGERQLAISALLEALQPFEALRQLANVAAEAYVEQRAQFWQTQAQRDPLTGLANRAALTERLAIELQRAQRYGRELTLVLLDVDQFKSVNDAGGHAAGDQVLCSLAELMQAALRKTDTAFRYGGDEFVLLLPETAQAQAALVLQRLSAQLVAQQWPGHGVSWGSATFPANGQTALELLTLADQRLYEQKRSRVIARS